MHGLLIGGSRHRGALALTVASLLWSGASLAASTSPVGEDTPSQVKVIGVRFGGDEATTRLVVDLDGPVSSRLISPPSPPGRVFLSLSPAVSGDAAFGVGHGRIKAWRWTQTASGDRLILDLADGAKIVHKFVLPPARGAGPYRLVVDVVDGAPAMVVSMGTRILTAEPGTQLPQTPMRRLKASVIRRVIVVDAGHGGYDPGAQSQTHNEKDVTLAAALVLKKRLEQTGRYRVVLTRASDVFIPLEKRVQIARKAGADLFISLHADSAGVDPMTHGASIYTLSDHGETRVNTVLGNHEWFTHAGKRSDPAVGQILLDLTQNTTRNRSSVFAGLLVEHLADCVDLLPRSHRDAGYFVLLAPDVPAALLEMGFISNPSDEARLTDSAQRRRLMDGIAAAIDDYFAVPVVMASG